MQKYLQAPLMAKYGYDNFDVWAAQFANIETTYELAPEGGYRERTRFSTFANLPELMTMYHECADVMMASDLDLDVPEAIYENVVSKPTEIQKQIMKELGERAEAIRTGLVDSAVDNMLKITSDGRKLGLDQRLISDEIPDEANTKVNVCADKIADIYFSSAETKGTQLVFCDLSTPKKDGTFNIYDDLKEKLIKRGVAENDIAFVHDYDTMTKKEALFKKVNAGDIRILFGSTQKCGAGTNVQEHLIALHHLDCPWRPADVDHIQRYSI